MVEYQLPKLATGVRFPSLAPSRPDDVHGIEAHERRATRGIGQCPTANELATQSSTARRSSRFPSLAPSRPDNAHVIDGRQRGYRENTMKLIGITVAIILTLLTSGCATKSRATIRSGASSYDRTSMIIRSSDIEPSAPEPTKPVIVKKSQSATRHIVKAGETLWAISKMYDVDVTALARENALSNSGTIEVGQVLSIPGNNPRRISKQVNYSPRRSAEFIWPVSGQVAAYFGSKVDKSVNKGIDIRSSEGANVIASRGGKIVYCDSKLKGFGHTVIIDHMDGFQTVYSYNSLIVVKVGDVVEQNDVIARVGSSGRANGSMLHFEIRKNGVPQNPEFYLSRMR